MLVTDSEPERFPLPALAVLQELVGADMAAGYVEAGSETIRDNYEVVTRAAPEWLVPALQAVGQQDPISAGHCAGIATPVAISDFLTLQEFRALDVYAMVCQPLGTVDSLRLYLPAPAGGSRFLFFDRSRRGFPTRARRILELLRPHLAVSRVRRRGAVQIPDGHHLTPRETQVMRLVAAGYSNAAIATQLWISEHTVRKHLESIFAKLEVHSRTAAVARLQC